MSDGMRRMDARVRLAGVVGFSLWGFAFVGCAVAAAASADAIGWDARLLWLLGAPLGVGCAWFFFRGPGRSWQSPHWLLRSGPAMGAVAGAWIVSDDFELFMVSFLAGLFGAPLVVWLSEMARARSARA